MEIRQFIFRKVAAHQPPRVKQYHNYYNIKTVLIIFESDYIERNTQLKNMIAKLKADGKEVDAWGYVDKKQTTTSTIAQFRTIGRSDVNLFYKPRKEKIAEMTSKHYDLLLDLRLKPCVPLQYLTLYANADLKAGADITENALMQDVKLLDFMVKIPSHEGEPTDNDTQLLFDELLHYIQIIK